MAAEARAKNSAGALLRVASLTGAAASVGLLIWMLILHWQAFMAWKAEAGFWPFFAGLALLPLVGVPVTPLFVLAGATFELLPALVGCAIAIAVNLTLSHWLARRRLRDWLLRLAARRQYELPAAGSQNRFAVLLLVRLTPGPPLVLKNYIGALIRAPFATYLAIYWTTSLLYAIALIVLGDSLKNASLLEMSFGMALLGALMAGVLGVLKRLRKNRFDGASNLAASDGEEAL